MSDQRTDDRTGDASAERTEDVSAERTGDAPADPAATTTPVRPIPALRGAITFLTRVPIPGGEPADWHSFRRSPWTLPVVGALVGGLAGLAFLLPSPWTAAVGYLAALYLVGGVTHADGLADLGDAVAVHDPDRRVAVLRDSSVGVGGVLALGVTLLATTLGALALATGFVGGGTVPGTGAFRVVLAAEVGAKVGMALLVCFGDSAHEGLGSALADDVGPASFLPVALLAATVLLAAPTGSFPALLAALLAGPAVAVLVLVRVRPWLGGISGDVLGATNEIGRAVALHAGVVVWALP